MDFAGPTIYPQWGAGNKILFSPTQNFNVIVLTKNKGLTIDFVVVAWSKIIHIKGEAYFVVAGILLILNDIDLTYPGTDHARKTFATKKSVAVNVSSKKV